MKLVKRFINCILKQKEKIIIKNCLIIFIVITIFLSSIVAYFPNNNTNNTIDAEESNVTEVIVSVAEIPIEEELVEWEYDNNLSTEENIFIYLTKYLEFSNSSACGIISNIAYETGRKFNSDAGSSSICYGLIQWRGNRLKKLKSWCEENEKDYTTIQGQLDFMHWELIYDDPYGTYDYLVQCEDGIEGAYDAGWYFCYWYERPNNIKTASKIRGRAAREYYKALVLKEN